MLNWLIPVLNFLGGPAINGLISAYKAKLQVENSADRLAVDLAFKDLEAQIEARKQATVLASTPLGGFVQLGFSLPLIAIWCKILIWDKMLGWGTTDPIEGAGATWANLIISFYFGGMIISNVTGKVLTILGRR